MTQIFRPNPKINTIKDLYNALRSRELYISSRGGSLALIREDEEVNKAYGLYISD